MQIKNLLVGCAATLLVVAPAFSQTLATVAKQEEARRNAVKAPSRTYTNSSLKSDPDAPMTAVGAKPSPPLIATPANPTPAAGAMAAPGNGTPAAPAAPAPPAEATLNEAYWRSRATDLRVRVEKARAEVAKLTGHKHDDPREQAKLDALLRRVQETFARTEESLKAFEREAATAGVPALWIQ